MRFVCIAPPAAVEFIERAHHDRDQREKQVQALRREQEELNAAIAECQENLPASGVPVTRQVGSLLDAASLSFPMSSSPLRNTFLPPPLSIFSYSLSPPA